MKVITFEQNKGHITESKFAIQDNEDLSKDFIMAKIESMLTNSEGYFELCNLSIKVDENITNFYSDAVSMRKEAEKLNNKIGWNK